MLGAVGAATSEALTAAACAALDFASACAARAAFAPWMAAAPFTLDALDWAAWDTCGTVTFVSA